MKRLLIPLQAMNTKLCNVKFFNFLSLIFDSVFRFRFCDSVSVSGFHVLVLPVTKARVLGLPWLL